MTVGILTAPFGGEPLENVIAFASEAGFDALEISAGPGSKHVDTAKLTKAEAKAIRSAVDAAGLEISSLAFYGKLCKDGEKVGLKFALENWFATNIMNLDQWALMFTEVPNDNFGLNFDPSHLYWQDIDHLAAVEEFAKRIFHTHAKDTEVRRHVRARIGNQTMGWWRYVIPGFGDIDWGVYIARLRRVGFNGVLSIEHEDSALGREEGFIKGLAYLRQFA